MVMKNTPRICLKGRGKSHSYTTSSQILFYHEQGMQFTAKLCFLSDRTKLVGLLWYIIMYDIHTLEFAVQSRKKVRFASEKA